MITSGSFARSSEDLFLRQSKSIRKNVRKKNKNENGGLTTAKPGRVIVDFERADGPHKRTKLDGCIDVKVFCMIMTWTPSGS